MNSLAMDRYNSHTLYTSDDFTHQEYAVRNKLAIVVIDGGLSVCKVCGRYEAELWEARCSTKIKETTKP